MNIQKILGNEEYDILIQKVNFNFNQITQLSGGPRGIPGKQGIPGLPGFQGKIGVKGDDGFNGNRLFLILGDSDYDPTGNALRTLPHVENLQDYILNHTYTVGDVFSHPDSYLGDDIYALSKIVEVTDGIYAYEKMQLKLNSSTGGVGIFITHTVTYNGESRPDTFLLRSSSTTNEQYLHNLYIDSRATDTPANASIALLDGSAGNSIIGLFDKNMFKFGVTQSPPVDATDSFFTTSAGINERIPNFYNVMADIADNYESINYKNGSDFNDPISGDGGDSVLSRFDFIRSLTPIIHLQGLQVTKSGTISSSGQYSDFGIFVQKVASNRFNNIYKSVLYIASGTNDNDVYIKTKNVWSDGNFISEINKNNQSDNNSRYYSVIKSSLVNNLVPAVTATQQVYYGLSTYYDNNGITDLKLVTGMEVSDVYDGINYISGNIKLYISDNTITNNGKLPVYDRRLAATLNKDLFTLANGTRIQMNTSGISYDGINVDGYLMQSMSSDGIAKWNQFDSNNGIFDVFYHKLHEFDKIITLIGGTNGDEWIIGPSGPTSKLTLDSYDIFIKPTVSLDIDAANVLVDINNTFEINKNLNTIVSFSEDINLYATNNINITSDIAIDIISDNNITVTTNNTFDLIAYNSNIHVDDITILKRGTVNIPQISINTTEKVTNAILTIQSWNADNTDDINDFGDAIAFLQSDPDFGAGPEGTDGYGYSEEGRLSWYADPLNPNQTNNEGNLIGRIFPKRRYIYDTSPTEGNDLWTSMTYFSRHMHDFWVKELESSDWLLRMRIEDEFISLYAPLYANNSINTSNIYALAGIDLTISSATDKFLTIDSYGPTRINSVNGDDVIVRRKATNPLTSASSFFDIWVESMQNGAKFMGFYTGDLNNKSSVGTIYNNNGILTINGIATGSSDIRIKKNIRDIKYGLNDILKIRPVSFEFKKNNATSIGFIAQEMYEVIPEIVYDSIGNENDLLFQPMSINYAGLTPILVTAIQEQQKNIEDKTKKIIELENRIKLIEEKIGL